MTNKPDPVDPIDEIAKRIAERQWHVYGVMRSDQNGRESIAATRVEIVTLIKRVLREAEPITKPPEASLYAFINYVQSQGYDQQWIDSLQREAAAFVADLPRPGDQAEPDDSPMSEPLSQAAVDVINSIVNARIPEESILRAEDDDPQPKPSSSLDERLRGAAETFLSRLWVARDDEGYTEEIGYGESCIGVQTSDVVQCFAPLVQELEQQLAKATGEIGLLRGREQATFYCMAESTKYKLEARQLRERVAQLESELAEKVGKQE